MNFIEYQQKAQEFAIYPTKGKDLSYPILGLNGEAGEVAEKYKKVLRDRKGFMDAETDVEIAKELGDVLWYLSDIAFELGISLETIAKMNIEKLSSRQSRNTLYGDGDNR